MHTLLWTKGSYQSPNFDTSNSSGENLPNSSYHFPNQKSSFLQILHDYSVSWKITPLYFFRSNVIYFARKGPIKVQIFETWVLWSKFTKFLSFLKQQVGFPSNFASLFSVTRHNSSVYFWLKFYILPTKGAYQSINLVKFHVSSRKSEILNFDGLLLSKLYNVSAKKVQKSYLSWYWRVMLSLNKNWLVVSNMTWEIWWIFTQALKSLKISLQWDLFIHSMRFELKKIQRSYLSSHWTVM